MDIYAIRAANLERLIAQLESRGITKRKDQAQSVGGLGSSYLSQLIKGKKIGDDTARKIETAMGLPFGFMDTETRPEANAHTPVRSDGSGGIDSVLPAATPRTEARLTTYRQKLERGEALSATERRDLASIIKRLEALNAAIT